MCADKYLKLLRKLMKNQAYVTEPIQAYIVPSGDAHQSEYLSSCDKRRGFLSGFTGSTGTAVITENEALLWTDGRYHIQAEKELGPNWTLMKDGLPSTPSMGTWLNKALPHSSAVGVDPWLMSGSAWDHLGAQIAPNEHRLVPVNENLVDLVWEGRPERPCNDVVPQELRYTGNSWPRKLSFVRTSLEEKGAGMLILTALDDIAWLFNLRGSDVNYNPVFFSWAAITSTDAYLFVDERKLTSSAKKHLSKGEMEEDAVVHILPYEQLSTFIVEQGSKVQGYVWIANASSYILRTLLPVSKLLTEKTPVQYLKSIKIQAEIDGMKNAHIKDAAALCRHLCWLEREVPKGSVSELSSAAVLDSFRSKQEDYVGRSFQTISCVGAHASVIHYRPSEATNVKLNCEEVYLVDSGGQYKDGTTDVTRTVHFGTPTDFEKECFTRVLKGHIAVASPVFPVNVKGNYLDTLARLSLWEVGLDYLHGTGHGVGSYLCVHEYPPRLTWIPMTDDPGISVGMFVSDEPGYYEDGKFGIRIESILMATETESKYKFKEQEFMRLEPVTLVPIQKKFIIPNMLTRKEIEWLNNYHSVCLEKVGPLLQQQDPEAYQWLVRETQQLG